jgi:hypothetical protein
MALQMSQSVSRHIAKFGINKTRKPVVPGLGPINSIEARSIT